MVAKWQPSTDQTPPRFVTCPGFGPIDPRSMEENQGFSSENDPPGGHFQVKMTIFVILTMSILGPKSSFDHFLKLKK